MFICIWGAMFRTLTTTNKFQYFLALSISFIDLSSTPSVISILSSEYVGLFLMDTVYSLTWFLNILPLSEII